jgi:hypothetical protein
MPTVGLERALKLAMHEKKIYREINNARVQPKKIVSNLEAIHLRSDKIRRADWREGCVVTCQKYLIARSFCNVAEKL